jgi:hypothetical protein
MRMYILLMHAVMSLFIGFSIISGIAHYFSTAWTQPFKALKPTLTKMSFVWILLLVPVFFFGTDLYQFANFKGQKAIFFSPGFLWGRQLVYLAFTIISYQVMEKRPWISLILMFIMGSFFSIDWGLSLEGTWFSNMYSFIYLASGVVAAMALLLLIKIEVETFDVKTDLVHLFLAFSLFWLYFQFSQFIIFWMGNLPREVVWYTKRLQGWKEPLTVIIPVLKVVPILGISLLSLIKVNPRFVRVAALSSLVGFALELAWVYL